MIVYQNNQDDHFTDFIDKNTFQELFENFDIDLKMSQKYLLKLKSVPVYKEFKTTVVKSIEKDNSRILYINELKKQYHINQVMVDIFLHEIKLGRCNIF